MGHNADKNNNRDHLTNLKPAVDSGFWLFGGATLDQPIKEGEKPQINGSVMLALAESKEEVLNALKEDVYFKSGVWDWDKVCVCSSPSLEVLLFPFHVWYRGILSRGQLIGYSQL